MNFSQEYIQLCERHGLFIMYGPYHDYYPYPISLYSKGWLDIKRTLQQYD